MKPTIQLFFTLLSLAFLTSCSAFKGTYSSRFVGNSPQLGMEKSAFVAMYGSPLRQNAFYDENNVPCEELIYREEIEHGGGTFTQGEYRALNSVFLFKNGKLVSQFQEDDREYQFQLERARERRLIEERINAEKAKAAAEKERIEVEKERIKAEKEKARNK